MTMTMIDRRRTFAIAAGAVLALAKRPALAQTSGDSAANQWFPVQGDDGHPVPNTRAPVELVEDIEDLPGAIWAGPPNAAVKLVEFYDYNCPWCRAAEKTLAELRAENPDLRIGLVNNPILGFGSAQAAKVDLALLKLKGGAASIALHRALFAAPGKIDGQRALAAVASLGHDRKAVEALADTPEIGAIIRQQLALAASLGLAATPSYVLGGAAILGYPGPKTLARMVADTRTCGAIVC